MRFAAAAIFGLCALIGWVNGGRYLSARRLMPYQLTTAGKSWDEIGAGERIVYLAMLRVVGGGFLSLGVAMAWTAYAVSAGVVAAPLAALGIGYASLLPALSATLMISRFKPGAKPPTALILASMALVALGAALAAL